MQTGDIYLSFYLHEGFIKDLRLLKVDYNQQKNNYFLLLPKLVISEFINL